jgi:tetratricopeptide (TPR) repeat protein
MEKQLGEIQSTFQSGKHNQAITELRTLIETSAKDDRIYKAYDLLGDYLNYMGKHVEAVDAWTNALELLEDTPGGIDNLNEQKLIDWMNISLTTAKVLYRLGRIRTIEVDLISINFSFPL